MISPGIRKIAMHFRLEKAGHYYAGVHKNCFLLIYPGKDMKVVKISFPFLNEDDKQAVQAIVSRYDFLSTHWMYTTLIIRFSEQIWFYPIKDILPIITSIVDYSAAKYPTSSSICDVCKLTTDPKVYYTKHQVMKICDSCLPVIKRRILVHGTIQKRVGKSYTSGTFGAVLYSCMAILISIISCNIFIDFGVLVSAGYYSLVRFGYERHHGLHSLFGICIVFFVGLFSCVCGSVLSDVSIMVIHSSSFDQLLKTLIEEKNRQHLFSQVGLSLSIYLFFSLFQLVRTIPYLSAVKLKKANPEKN